MGEGGDESGPVLDAVSAPAETPPVVAPEPPARGVDTAVLLSSVALADFFLYPALGGTGYSLAVLAQAVLLWGISPRRLSGNTVSLLGLVLVLTLGGIWKVGVLTVVLPFLLLATLAAVQRRDLSHWLDATMAGLLSLPPGPFRIPAHIGRVIRWLGERERARGVARWAIPVLMAVLVLAIFGSILLEANPLFATLWEKVKDLLSLEEIWNWLVDLLLPSPVRVLLWVFVAALVAGLLRPLDLFGTRVEGEDQRPPERADADDLLGRTSLLSLGAACLLFLLFDAADVLYLWVRLELPEGVTDSQYAWRGTGWLTFALALSTLLVGLATAEIGRNSRYRRTNAALALAWVGLDFFMGICVLRRIQYYVGVSGLTPLRITGFFGTCTVIAGVLLMGYKVRRGKNLVWLVRRYAVVFLAGLSLWTAFPSDMVCAKYNARRAMDGDPRTLMLLFSSRIACEGLADYVPLLDHTDPMIARGVSAYLAKRRAQEARLLPRFSDEDWRLFQLGMERTRRRLVEVKVRLHEDTAALQTLSDAVWGGDQRLSR